MEPHNQPVGTVPGELAPSIGRGRCTAISAPVGVRPASRASATGRYNQILIRLGCRSGVVLATGTVASSPVPVARAFRKASRPFGARLPRPPPVRPAVAPKERAAAGGATTGGEETSAPAVRALKVPKGPVVAPVTEAQRAPPALGMLVPLPSPEAPNRAARRPPVGVTSG